MDDGVRDAVGGVVEVDEGESLEVKVPTNGDAVGKIVGGLEAGWEKLGEKVEGGVVPTGEAVLTKLPAALPLGVEEKLIDRVDVAEGEAVAVIRAVEVADVVEDGVFV